MAGRLVFLGIDGIDPVTLEALMEGGLAPNFRRLAETGRYNRLATVDPPQSPVVWSSIATGQNPGEHGIYDFIRRTPPDYTPALSLLRLERSRYAPPVAAQSFWEEAAGRGIPSVVLKYPVTFPPRPFKGRILAGLGVPDIRGTLGLYTLFTDDPSVDGTKMKGKVVPVEVRGGRFRAEIPGPFAAGAGGRQETTAPLSAAVSGGRVRCEAGGVPFELEEGGWSGWIPVTFRLGFLRSVTGLCRFHLNSASPLFSLYMTPVNAPFDSAELPVSSPPGYAGELSRAAGPFATLGLPEDTNALADGALSDDAFLSMCDSILDERERLFEHELARFRDGILACVFDTTDRVQHMFYRALDPEHPLHDRALAERYGGVVERYYRRMDAIVGKVLDRAPAGTDVVICSDHGFAPFRKSVHVNRWLAANGYLRLEEGRDRSDGLFEGVDWGRTSAYALGLNGIFLNLRGREGRGIVREDEAPRIRERIARDLESLSDAGSRVVARVHDTGALYGGKRTAEAPDLVVGYARDCRGSWQTAVGGVPAGDAVERNTGKWSGDHCCDASLVPGVFLCSGRDYPRTASVLDVRQGILDRTGK